MKQIKLDGQRMLTRDNAHAELARAFGFPAHYGKNLDALYDVLTDLAPTECVFEHSEDMVEALAPYGLKLLQTLIESSIKNPNFKLKIAWEKDEDGEE